MAPRVAGCMTGPGRPGTAPPRAWPGGCWCAAAAATGSWPSTPAMARRPRRCSAWSGWQEPGGRWRRALSRPRARWAWITTRSAMAGLVSPHHPGAAGARVLGRHPRQGRRLRAGKGGHGGLNGGLGLLPLTVPEVRRLLVALVWTRAVEPGFVLAWSRWRRRHQARARRAHYQRRERQLRQGAASCGSRALAGFRWRLTRWRPGPDRAGQARPCPFHREEPTMTTEPGAQPRPFEAPQMASSTEQQQTQPEATPAPCDSRSCPPSTGACWPPDPRPGTSPLPAPRCSCRRSRPASSPWPWSPRPPASGAGSRPSRWCCCRWCCSSA